MSGVRVSVRASNFFIREKHPKPRGNRVASTCAYLNDPATGHECQRNKRKGALTPSRLGATDASNLNGDGGVHVCARMHACMRMRACIRECVRDVFAIYDNNISPRLIMIIINILYFIQIRHTDDFHSTGTRLV